MKTLIKELKKDTKVTSSWTVEPFHDEVKNEDVVFLYNKYNKIHFLICKGIIDSTRKDIYLFKDNKLLFVWRNKTIFHCKTIIDIDNV